ncbi:serine/threonine-protein kinase [Lysobacter sp. HA18]
MDAATWLRLSPHLDELLELDPPERDIRLTQIAGDDAALAADLTKMLALEDGRDDFLAEPIIVPKALLREGSEVGPYRLEELLGEGGMGQVWRASRADGLYQRRVALKLLRPGLTDQNLRLRFARERQILARLAHPHIAGLLDAGVSTEGIPYLALEYVEGEPITRYWQRLDVPLDARLRMFRQVCAAVSHAHANLVVHCDLKPSNILVTQDGQVRLLDFGIAKLLDGGAPRGENTRTGARAFTLHYAAPEQIRGAPVTTMTDVYSLGVVLYELLTGTKPYRLKRQSDAEWEEAILTLDPVRPSQMLQRLAEPKQGLERQQLRRRARRLVGDLDNIVMRTLCKPPEQRYPSVEALSEDLARHLDGRPVQARPQGLLYIARKYMRRHRWALAGTVAAVVFVGVAVGVTWRQSREAVDEAQRAQAMRDFIAGVFEKAAETRDAGAVDLRTLLDAAVERGDRELAREPASQAELFGLVARLRMGLGDYPQALALLERQRALIEHDADMPESLRIEASALRGDVLRRTGDPRACVAGMRPLETLAESRQAALPTPAAEFFSQLGRCERALGDVPRARSLFTRALTLRQSINAPGSAVAEIESRLDLATLQVDQGEFDDALRTYRVARDRLDAEVGMRHPLQVDIGRQIATVERRLGHPGRAERELVDTLTIAQDVHGAQHPITLAVRRELADVLIDQSRYRDAALPLRTRHAELSARLPANSPELRDSHLMLARVEWQLGRLPAAMSSLQAALAIDRHRGDVDAIADSLALQAQVLHEAGQNDEARALLDEARTMRIERHGAADASVADIDRRLGDVDAATDDPRAIPELTRALHFLRLGYGGRDPRTRLAQLSLAHAQAVQGDAVALQLLDVIAASGRESVRPQPLAWRAAGYADAVRCAGRPRSAGARHLDRLVDAVRVAQPDGSVVLRELEQLRRECQRPSVQVTMRDDME